MNQNNIENALEITLYSKPSILIFEMEAENLVLFDSNSNSNVDIDPENPDEWG